MTGIYNNITNYHKINGFKSRISRMDALPPLDRRTDGETCADEHAGYDSTNGVHAGFRDDICTPRGWA